MVVFAITHFFKVKGQMSAKKLRKRVWEWGYDAIGQCFRCDVTSAVDTTAVYFSPSSSLPNKLVITFHAIFGKK